MPTYNLANNKFHLHVEALGGDKEIVQSIAYMIENINLLLTTVETADINQITHFPVRSQQMLQGPLINTSGTWVYISQLAEEYSCNSACDFMI